MLKNKRQNFHHSALPTIGSIVTLPGLQHVGFTGSWIVVSCALYDSPDPRYALGIHMVTIQSLANRNVERKVSGIHCLEY